MNYELAKQLKDAGFPQPTIPPGKGNYDMHEDDASGETLAYFSTLEELIEACGDDLFSLRRGDMNGSRIWIAQCCDRATPYHKTEGATPTEAVAKLWLALNPR